jgi:hypothetical protein
MVELNRIQQFLQRLTPLTRSSLMTELERLETCDSEMPGSEEILAVLRAEFGKDGSPQSRLGNPARYFFEPLEPLLVEGAPEHANPGRIQRGSLPPVWEWISRDLLRTMARDYVNAIDKLVAADNQREARKVAAAFHTKVIKSLEGTLGSPEGAEQTRVKLATYTASRTACADLAKMLCALRARDALGKFNEALPATIKKFDDAAVAKITALLDAFAKKHTDAVPFALALVAKRLKTAWELIRLATKAARSKNATDVGATRYAIAVSLVLDQLDDKRLALRLALRNNRVFIAKQILKDIYDTEFALRVRIDMLDQSEWGKRLRDLMDAIAALVEAEIARFPDEVDHVLGSRSLRSHQSIAGRITYLAWKGRDAISDGAAYCKKLLGQTGKSGSKSGLRASPS